MKSRPRRRPIGFRIKPPDRRVTPPGKHTVDGGLLGMHHEAPLERQGSDPVMKLGLDGCKVGEDVGVIKL
jgi:hypothetical protein